MKTKWLRLELEWNGNFLNSFVWIARAAILLFIAFFVKFTITLANFFYFQKGSIFFLENF